MLQLLNLQKKKKIKKQLKKYFISLKKILTCLNLIRSDC